MQKHKFLVLRTKIAEKEDNLSHQFFRRKRYRVLVEYIIEYLTLVDKLPMVKLNKNISNIIKENNYLEKIPKMKEELNLLMKYIIRYHKYNFIKFCELDLYTSIMDYDFRKMLPVLFVKLYSDDLTQINLNITRKCFGKFGAELLAYYVKLKKYERIDWDSIKRIDIFCNTIYFPQCDNIREIVLTNTLLLHNAAKQIFNLKNLISFQLTYTVLTNKLGELCTAIIEGGSQLQTLILNNNKIKDEGADGILKLIKEYPHLRYLDISNNQINGENFIKFSEALNYDSHIECFIINNNKLLDKSVRTFFLNLCKGRPKMLKSLDMSNNPRIRGKALEMVGKFVSRKDCPLEELQLYVCGYSSKDTFKFLSKIKPHSKLSMLKIGSWFDKNDINRTIKKINVGYELNIKLL